MQVDSEIQFVKKITNTYSYNESEKVIDVFDFQSRHAGQETTVQALGSKRIGFDRVNFDRKLNVGINNVGLKYTIKGVAAEIEKGIK